MDFGSGAGLTLQEPLRRDHPESPMKQMQITKRQSRREQPVIDMRTPSGRVLPF